MMLPVGIPGPRAPASLKQGGKRQMIPFNTMYSGASRPGLIEASFLPHQKAADLEYSGASRPGLIEATPALPSKKSAMLRIPGPRAPASLKLPSEMAFRVLPLRVFRGLAPRPH